VVTSQGLRKKRKYAILIMFAGAAFFTPPDVVSQILMAVPLMVLYEISIWLVAASQKKKEAKQAAQEAEFADEPEPPADES
jgi:sec-independent protein translocase protein TatC